VLHCLPLGVTLTRTVGYFSGGDNGEGTERTMLRLAAGVRWLQMEGVWRWHAWVVVW